jgi:hypothetical protein
MAKIFVKIDFNFSKDPASCWVNKSNSLELNFKFIEGWNSIEYKFQPSWPVAPKSASWHVSGTDVSLELKIRDERDPALYLNHLEEQIKAFEERVERGLKILL